MKTLKQKYDKTVKAYLDAFCQKNGAEIVEVLPYVSRVKIFLPTLNHPFSLDHRLQQWSKVAAITFDDLRFDVDNNNIPAGTYAKWYYEAVLCKNYPVAPYRVYCKKLLLEFDEL